MLDPNRFTKGVSSEPCGARRCDGASPQDASADFCYPTVPSVFPERRIYSIDVVFPPEERELFDLLDRYTALRMGSAGTQGERAASRFVTLLLRKRLLSSPAAFKHTLDQHIRTLDAAARRRATRRALQQAVAALEDNPDDTAVVSGYEQEALALAGAAIARSIDRDHRRSEVETGASAVHADEAGRILTQMQARADTCWRRPDAKTKQLLGWIAETCFPRE